VRIASGRTDAGRDSGDLTSGADGAADVGEGVLDLLPQRGEDEHHHDGDQHEDQAYSTMPCPCSRWERPRSRDDVPPLEARRYAEVIRVRVLRASSRIHSQRVTSESERNPNSV